MQSFCAPPFRLHRGSIALLAALAIACGVCFQAPILDTKSEPRLPGNDQLSWGEDYQHRSLQQTDDYQGAKNALQDISNVRSNDVSSPGTNIKQWIQQAVNDVRQLLMVGSPSNRTLLQEISSVPSWEELFQDEAYLLKIRRLVAPVRRLSQIAAPAILVVNFCKVALGVAPKGAGTFKYNFAAAVYFNVLIMVLSAVGIHAILATVLLPHTVSNDSLLQVLVLFLPSMAEQLVQCTVALVQLLSVSRLVARQVQLQRRLRDTLVDLQGGWPGLLSPHHARKRARVLKYLTQMINKQKYFVTNFRMKYVQAEMLLFDLQRCIQFGKGQQAQLQSGFAASNPRAVVTGYRQLCVRAMIEDMYQKQGTLDRREQHRSMSKVLAKYKPVQAFLEQKVVPYHTLTVLRRMLSVLGVFVGDYDVRYLIHCLRLVDETLHSRRSWYDAITLKQGETLDDGDQPERIKKRYGAGQSSRQLIAQANRCGFRGGLHLRTGHGKSTKRLLEIPGASRSAVDFLVRKEIEWSIDFPRWKWFSNVPLARYGANSIVAKFTPAGRELSKLVARFREADGEGWLDNKKDLGKTIGGFEGEAMALADLLYWAAESGALGGKFAESVWYRNRADLPAFSCPALTAHFWKLQQDNRVDKRRVIAQDTIASRLLMMPVYSMVQKDGVLDELIWDDRLVMNRAWARDALRRISKSVAKSQAALGELQNAAGMLTVKECAAGLGDEGQPDGCPDALSVAALASLGNFLQQKKPLHIAERSVYCLQQQLSSLGQGEATFEQVVTAAESLQQFSKELKMSIVGIVLHVSNEVGPEARECLARCAANHPTLCPSSKWLLLVLEGFCGCLFHANRTSSITHKLICLLGQSAQDMSAQVVKVDVNGYWVENDAMECLASLVTCLVIHSRMALVTMLLMSGLWPRLLAERSGPEPTKKMQWTLEKHWMPHVLTLLLHAATAQNLQWNGFEQVVPTGNYAASQQLTTKVKTHGRDNFTADGKIQSAPRGLVPDDDGVPKNIDEEAQATGTEAPGAPRRDSNLQYSNLFFSIGRLLRRSTDEQIRGLISGEPNPAAGQQRGNNVAGRFQWLWKSRQAAYQDTSDTHSPQSRAMDLQKPPEKIKSRSAGADRNEQSPPVGREKKSSSIFKKLLRAQQPKPTMLQTPDPFLSYALTKLLDSYQMLLVTLAREKFSRELQEAGGTYLLVRTLDNPRLRAAIVASVVCGSELPKDLLMESESTRPKTLWLGLWNRWQDSADPLYALQNLGRYPNVLDDADDEDGWY